MYHCIELSKLFVTSLCGCCANLLIRLALYYGPLLSLTANSAIHEIWGVELTVILILERLISHKILYFIQDIKTNILKFGRKKKANTFFLSLCLSLLFQYQFQDLAFYMLTM